MKKFREFAQLDEAKSDDVDKFKSNVNEKLKEIKKLAQVLPNEIRSEGPVKFPNSGDIKSIVKQADDIEKTAKDLKKALK